MYLSMLTKQFTGRKQLTLILLFQSPKLLQLPPLLGSTTIKLCNLWQVFLTVLFKTTILMPSSHVSEMLRHSKLSLLKLLEILLRKILRTSSREFPSSERWSAPSTLISKIAKVFNQTLKESKSGQPSSSTQLLFSPRCSKTPLWTWTKSRPTSELSSWMLEPMTSTTWASKLPTFLSLNSDQFQKLSKLKPTKELRNHFIDNLIIII